MRRGRALCAVAITAGALACAGQAEAASPAQLLADRYAPIVRLKRNDDLPCGKGGEQFWAPTPVGVILGNPAVKLEYAPKGQKAKVIRRGATGADLLGLGDGYYLNQPGIPHRPRCRYARDAARLTRGRTPVTYAHVATERGVRGFALQYWFYYWFNRFNDLHESDWEMIQLAFENASVEDVLERRPTPSRIAYAQHGGGEVADWDDSKVDKIGWHPIVYAASGSHASQYESALYLGRGRQGSGLGCDDTRGESYEVAPRPILVPTFPSSRELGWLGYGGHWGQKARGFSNGVGGPNLKQQWLHPFTWMDGLRHNTPEMPVSQSAGVTVTDFFCGAIIAVADVGNFVGNRNWLVVLIVLGLVATTAVPVRRTRWRPAPADPLRQERVAGQLLRVATVVYRRYAASLLVLVTAVVSVVYALNRVLQLLENHTSVSFRLDLAEPGVDSLASLVVAAPAYPLVLVLVGSPIVALLRRVDAGEPARPWSALRDIVPLLPRLVLVEILALFALGLLVATVIGIPFAVKKAVDWTFAAQEVVFERRKARDALGASTRAVRGRWWGVAAVDLSLFVIGTIPGPLIGSLLIIFTDAPLWTVNLAGLVFFGLTLPFMIITLTLMWLDPRTQTERAARAPSRLAFWRGGDTTTPAGAAR